MKLTTDHVPDASMSASVATARRAEPAASWYRPAVLAAMVLAAVNGFAGIGANSVARDEGFSISTSLRSWSSLVSLSLHTETNAWPYAFALKAWSALGTSPGLLRVPSALAFVALVPLTAELARRLFGLRVAALTAAFVAVNGSLLMFAQQIRGYTLAAAAATACMLVFVADVQRPRRATLVGWVALVVATGALHLQMLAVVLPQLASLVALEPARRLLRRRLGALAVGLVIVAPIPIAIANNEEGQRLFDLRLGVFRDVLFTFAGRGGVLGVLVFAAAGLVLVGTVRTLARSTVSETERFGPYLVLATIVLPFVAVLVASLVQPMVIGRYLLFCVPAMVIALAVLVDRLLGIHGARRSLALVAAALLTVGAARGSASWHADSHTEPWDEVTAYVFANARADDRLVVANDSIRLFFEYERTRLDAPPAGPAPGYPNKGWGDYGTGDQRYASPTVEQLGAVASAAPRLWVVVGREHVDTDVMAERLVTLDGTFRVAERRTFPQSIDVILYERTAP